MAGDGDTIDEVIRAQTGVDGEDEGLLEDEIVDEPVTPMDELREELAIGVGVDPVAALLDAPVEAPTDEVFIRRLGASFTVEAILDDKAYDKIVERCTKRVRNRRGGGSTREVDGRRLSRLTLAEYTVKPAFSMKRATETGTEAAFELMVEKYGTRDPEDLVGRALLLGEIDMVTDRIMTISGFEDELETAGN